MNDDPKNLMMNLQEVQGTGLGVHINFWSGPGVYHESVALGLFTHYQRSGVEY